jgi:Tfp pilus assembly protein FimT
MGKRLPDYHLSSYVLNLKGAIQNARIAAVRNNSEVVVNLDKTNGQCVVFVDNNGSGGQDAGESTIGNFAAAACVVFTELFSSTANTQVTINSRGFSDKSGNICLKNSNDKYKGVSLTLAGCTSIIRSSDGSTWN